MLELSLVFAILIVLLACWFEFWCREKPPTPQISEKDICEDVDDEDSQYDSEGTEIICSSSEEENWSEDLSDFYFTETSSARSLIPTSRRVTWGKSNWTDKNRWQLNPSENVEVLYPAKSCLKRTSSTVVDSKSSSKGSASSSNDRHTMFETHFRLLISLLLRRQPCADAREHLDWIFQNCPSYQKRLVIRFMKSFGMDVDRNGNLRGFRPRGNVLRGRSGGRKRNKRRVCHLRPKKMQKDYQCQQETDWYDEETPLKPSFERCRGEPEGSSDIDGNITISPDYSDILKSVIPRCLETLPASDAEDSDQDADDQDELPECSPPSNTSSQLDMSSQEVTSILKKASAMQCLALRHKNPSITSGLPSYLKYLTNIEKIRKSYAKFIDEIPWPVPGPSSYESGLCIRKTAMDHIHHMITNRVMQKMASLEERYRGILSNKSQW